MAIRKVAAMGNPVLRKVAAPIPEKDVTTPRIQTLIRDMIDTMHEYEGRGLAAPQIHESLQLVVMLWDFDEEEDPSILVLINPKIEVLTEETSTYWEGCLSVPGLRGKVARPKSIRVKALNQKKEKLTFTVEGFAATVVQHECDHLQGILYVDRITDLKQGFAFNKEYQRYLAPDAEEAGEAGEEEGESEEGEGG